MKRIFLAALAAIALAASVCASAAEKIAEGTLSATGSSDPFAAGGPALSGGRRDGRSLLLVMRGDGVGTVYLERTPDGTNWYPVPADASAAAVAIAVNNAASSLDFNEPIPGATWRVRFARTSGSVIWEIWR